MFDPSVVDPRISLLLNVSTNHAVIGHIIQYNLTVYNKSKTTIDNAVVIDKLNPCFKFVDGSVKIDSIEYKDANIVSGIETGTIEPKGKKLITFNVEVVSSDENCNAMTTNITVFYNYNSNDKDNAFNGKVTASPLTIMIHDNNIQVSKSSSSNSASLNDIIKYTILLENNSHLEAYDVLLEDNNPNSTSLINGTFTINGTVIENVNLNYGVNLGNIGVGQSIVVEYQVRILTSDCSGIIQSSSSTTYNYFLPNGYVGAHICYSNIIEISINLSYKRQFIFDNSTCIPKQLPDIDHVNWMNGDLIISDWKPINSIRCNSKSPNSINGVKLLVTGKILYNFCYSTTNLNEEIRVEGIEAPFKGTIILLCDYTSENAIQVNGCVTDIIYQSSDDRCVVSKSYVELTAEISH
jgi:uncharacterized repeat protein (TIGR01451 family)